MATYFNINCGCGFTTHSVEAAEEHSHRTGHTLQILGTISTKEI